jgi:hypothetical protein
MGLDMQVTGRVTDLPVGQITCFCALQSARRDGFATGAATGRIVFDVLRSQSRPVWQEVRSRWMSP